MARMAAENLHVVTRYEADRVVLELHGELDLLAAPMLASELERADSDHKELVVLDLEDLQFIDSSGLRVILAAHAEVTAAGQAFAITPGTAQVQRLLSIAGVNEHLQTIATPDAALGGDSRADPPPA